MLRAVYMREEVQGLKESRLTIRGDDNQGLAIVASEEILTSPVI